MTKTVFGWCDEIGEALRPYDFEWAEWIRENTEGLTPAIQDLHRQLLAFAGHYVSPQDDPYAHLTAVHGEFYDGRSAVMVYGQNNRCHDNACMLAQEDPDTYMYTGYALSEDGCWRPHSWAEKNGTILETTEARLAYFGFRVTGQLFVTFATTW